MSSPYQLLAEMLLFDQISRINPVNDKIFIEAQSAIALEMVYATFYAKDLHSNVKALESQHFMYIDCY